MTTGPFRLGTLAARARAAKGPAAIGRVHQVLGQLIEVVGLMVPVGGQLEVPMPDGSLLLEVMGFREGKALCVPLGPLTGIEPGVDVVIKSRAASAPVGDALLGRVVDAFGEPLDGKPRLQLEGRASLRAAPPAPFTRHPIHAAAATGVRAMDGLLPLGVGQRIGLFAGTGVGKSTLLGMLCRRMNADVAVVGLIGERGREVGDFVRGALGDEGLARSVVVAATGDMAPLVRVRGALYATAIAEHFRAQGKSVLLVMDSVTRYAMALRDATLAAGEPPLTKGYTPTVFASLPALLERAGTCEGDGAITAVYTVLVEGDDLQDPIADAVRGILDGHVVLTRKLADRGLFPAIDVLKSVSRLIHDISSKEHVRAAAFVRDQLAVYSEAADLIQIGAYVAGSDARIDAARAALPQIEAFLRQDLDERVTREESLARLAQLAGVGALR